MKDFIVFSEVAIFLKTTREDNCCVTELFLILRLIVKNILFFY